MASLYNNSIDVLLRALKTTSSILKKGEQYAKENNISETDLISTRIYEDMYPLTTQVEYVVTLVRTVVERLTGASQPESQGDKKTLQELYAIIDDARRDLETIDRGSVDGKEESELVFSVGPRIRKKGATAEYIRLMVIPNLYFHLSITYAILRMQGVPLGKLDYLNEFIGSIADA